MGVVSGAFGALFGVGGGVILVPMLSLVAGLTFRDAVGAGLVSVAAMSVAGSTVFLFRHLVALETGLEFQFFSVFGAVAAGLAAPLVPETPLYFLFATLLIVAATQMWPRRKEAAPHRWSRAKRHARIVGNGAALGSGMVSGLLGVGGGILNTPVLHLVHGLSFQRAAATSIFVIGATASGAASVYLIRGEVDLGVAGVTMIGCMTGAGPVALLGPRVNQTWLKLGFAALLTVVALQMLSRGLWGG